MSVEESLEFYDAVIRYYDAENAHKVDDLPFYSMMAANVEGPILDVGSGTGRVVIHLAQEGHQLWGLEPSRPMLARAERKLTILSELGKSITMVEADIMSASFDRQFDLITVSYHAFMHLRTQEDQIAALERFHEWLSPDGLLVIDLPNVGSLFESPDDGSIILERTFIEPESGHVVMQQSVSDLDRAEQMMYITWIYDEIDDSGVVKRTIAPLTMHYYFPAEMELLLRVAGLQKVTFYGDYEGGDFDDGCPRMIVVASR